MGEDDGVYFGRFMKTGKINDYLNYISHQNMVKNATQNSTSSGTTLGETEQYAPNNRSNRYT